MSASKPAFGVQIACAGMNWPECLDISQAAEELGYESVWVPDHYVSTPDGLEPDVQDDLIEGWAALGAIAQATKRIRLGPLVASCTFRNPGILAKMAASLDHISGGRIELGMGAGWYEFEHTSLDIAYPPLGQRLRQLAEAVQIVKALWSQEVVDFQGEFYSLTGAVSMPKPLQQPAPPITIGASGEKVALRNVARFADHWNTYCPPDQFAHKAEVLDRHCNEVGRSPEEIRRSVMIPAYLEEDETTRAKLERWTGIVQGKAEEAREWFLIGDDAEIQGRIDRFARSGADLIIVQVDIKGRNVATLEQFAKRFL